MRFDLQELEYFLAVANERNFTRAAEESHVTQPAMSRKIQDMEKRLGAVLIERTTRKVRLTEAGEIFKRYASAILETCEEAEQAVRRCAEKESQALALGYGSRAQFEYLLRLIHILHAEHPDLQLNATHGITYERLFLHQLDAALMMEGSLKGQDWADFVRLDNSGLSVYFPRGFFPADRTDVSVSDLAGCRFLIPERHMSERGIPFTSLHDLIVGQLLNLGLSKDQIHTGYDAQEFCSRIMTERCLGIMPDSSRIVTGDLICSLPLRECRSGFGIVLAWNRSDSDSGAIQALRASASAMLRNA